MKKTFFSLVVALAAAMPAEAADQPGTAWDIVSDLTTEIGPRLAGTEAEARAREKGPTWVYQLNFANPHDGGRYGAHHTLDIPLVFANTATTEAETGDGAAARAVSAAMSDALLRFARTGDPSGGRLGAWPRYELPHRATMTFDVESRVENDPRKAERELFAQAPYIQPGTY